MMRFVTPALKVRMSTRLAWAGDAAEARLVGLALVGPAGGGREAAVSGAPVSGLEAMGAVGCVVYRGWSARLHDAADTAQAGVTGCA